MIGQKKLGTIKQELRQILGKNDKQLQAWLNQQLTAKRPNNARNAQVEEDLLWARTILQEAISGKKPRGKKQSNKKTARVIRKIV